MKKFILIMMALNSIAAFASYTTNCYTTSSIGEGSGYYKIDSNDNSASIEFFSSNGSLSNGKIEARKEIVYDGLELFYFTEFDEERFIVLAQTSEDYLLGHFPKGYPTGTKVDLKTVAQFGSKIESLDCR